MNIPRLAFVTPERVARLTDRVGGVARLLSPRETDAYHALRARAVEKRCTDWVAGRVAAKLALRAEARALGVDVPHWRAITIGAESSGAPRLEVGRTPVPGDALSLSIAHDHGHAVCALTRVGELGWAGVDVERERTLDPGLLRFMLGDGERRRFGARPNGRPDPLHVWTAKEALLKAAHPAGCRSMRELDIRWRGRRPIRVRLVGDALPDATLRVAHRRWRGHLVAWATCRLHPLAAGVPSGEAVRRGPATDYVA